MLKMQTQGNITKVTERGVIKFVGNLTEAWQYVAYRRFIALVQGARISYKVDKHNYIRSLVPPLKKVVVYTIEQEAV